MTILSCDPIVAFTMKDTKGTVLFSIERHVRIKHITKTSHTISTVSNQDKIYIYSWNTAL